MNLEPRFNNNADFNSHTLTRGQNRNVLIAGLTCACFSLAVALVTLRWFILMKKTFRHRLVLLLILSDTFKAVWYFVFPVIVFTRGPVAGSSKFCQASGFFLAWAIEASDFAILIIALHSIIYIFRPPTKTGESGGLFRWRNWVYALWILLPLLMASLAFVNKPHGYTSAGTFCYLPKRPFWYRLALAWIPRYMIMSTIVMMYIAVYIYVTVKFRSFGNLGASSPWQSTSESRNSSVTDEDIGPDELPQSRGGVRRPRPANTRTSSKAENAEAPPPRDPWDDVSFITSKSLQKTPGWQPGFSPTESVVSPLSSEIPASYPSSKRGSTTQPPVLIIDPFALPPRKGSAAPTTGSSLTGDTIMNVFQVRESRDTSARSKLPSTFARSPRTNDPLQRTRNAIRKQLRYLFVYPAVYIIMWAFPFAAHCLLYNDYYASHPIFWLSILQTVMLALQAGADCVVFSWREKPWRRIPDNSKFTWLYWRKSFAEHRSRQRSIAADTVAPSTARHSRFESLPGESPAVASGQSSRATSTHWWEAEGKKRKDSVWLGIDMGNIASVLPGRRHTDEHGHSRHSALIDVVPEEQEAERPIHSKGSVPEVMMVPATPPSLKGERSRSPNQR